MKKSINNIPTFAEVIAHNEEVLNVCNKKIESITHPEVYGFCVCKCNSIVINKERLMTVTTDETNHTTYEFSPLYPTFFSPEAARHIVENDIYKDINDNPIKMEIIGELEYYRLLKENAEKTIKLFKSIGA